MLEHYLLSTIKFFTNTVFIESISDRNRFFHHIIKEGVDYTLFSSFPFPEQIARVESSSKDLFYPILPCAYYSCKNLWPKWKYE